IVASSRGIARAAEGVGEPNMSIDRDKIEQPQRQQDDELLEAQLRQHLSNALDARLGRAAARFEQALKSGEANISPKVFVRTDRSWWAGSASIGAVAAAIAIVFGSVMLIQRPGGRTSNHAKNTGSHASPVD